ncbi:MAG: hypothetical protein KDA78_20705, partial [Planctomycetaceae bacterium]|nr:hypothetical protein [Planctomycetaceae bacterium]
FDERQPLWLEESKRTPNYRKCDELVWNQLRANQNAVAERTLRNIDFNEAKCEAGMFFDIYEEYSQVFSAPTTYEQYCDLSGNLFLNNNLPSHTAQRWYELRNSVKTPSPYEVDFLNNTFAVNKESNFHIKPVIDKRQAKKLLSTEAGQPIDTSVPLFAYVGRATYQTGFDLLVDAIPELPKVGWQLFVNALASRYGEEQRLFERMQSDPRVTLMTHFNERLAKLAIAAADVILFLDRIAPGIGYAAAMVIRSGTFPIISSSYIKFPSSTGWRFKSGDAIDLATRITEAIVLFQDADTRESISSSIRDTDLTCRHAAREFINSVKGWSVRSS